MHTSQGAVKCWLVAVWGNQATLSESGEARTTFEMIAVLVYTRKKMSRSRPAQRAWSGLLVVGFTMTKVWSKAQSI